MQNDLFNEIIASGISEKDARNAIELAEIVSKIDESVYLESRPIEFIEKSPFHKALRLNRFEDSYLISISETSKRVERVEFSFFLNDKKIISKEEKFMTLTVSEIRERLQETGFRLFTPNFKFRDHRLQNILEKLALIKRYGLNGENMIIFDKKRFDSQLISLICLYYYRLGASLSKISKIITLQPK